jgi:hypothetical protein
MIKKDLLIFGDSYGEEDIKMYQKDEQIYPLINKLINYHSLLRDSNRFDRIVSYADGGCSLWVQYKEFKKRYTGNETVLWFLTEPGRFTIDLRNTSFNGIFNVSSVSSLHHHIWLSETQNEDEYITDIFKSAADYVMWMRDNEKEEYLHSKLIEEIQYIAGDNLHIIDTFNFFKKSNPSLLDIFVEENKMLLGKHDWTLFRRAFKDIRRNHIIEENHVILAQLIIDKIFNGVEIDFSKLAKPKQSDFKKYFIPWNVSWKK